MLENDLKSLLVCYNLFTTKTPNYYEERKINGDIR
jgi:hypothetical protein